MDDSNFYLNIVKRLSVDLLLSSKRLTYGISRMTFTSTLAFELTMGHGDYENKAFGVLNV